MNVLIYYIANVNNNYVYHDVFFLGGGLRVFFN